MHNEVKKVFNKFYEIHSQENEKIGKKIYKNLDRFRMKRNPEDYEKKINDLKYKNNVCITYSNIF
ncbi:MAG: hypothetical protein LBT66_05105 [Methanobrevibacter sp.]|nr:hypothetical protein [Candidatus Methanovirga meridionalis]